METLKIDIINPKARKIIEELADLNLINIQENNPIMGFELLLSRLRKSRRTSLADITKEVEVVRSKRYGKKS